MSESISLQVRPGLPTSVDGYAVGALREPTKATKALPEAERRYWHAVQVAPSEDPRNAVRLFCEAEHFYAVAKALRDAGEPVPVRLGLFITSDSVNVDTVEV